MITVRATLRATSAASVRARWARLVSAPIDTMVTLWSGCARSSRRYQPTASLGWPACRRRGAGRVRNVVNAWGLPSWARRPRRRRRRPASQTSLAEPLAAAVGGVRERAEQQRHVVALPGTGDPEGDHDLGVERVLAEV